ncbi:ATP-binding protein [Vibrio sp. WXL103]|uniref:ATP-binding protein n=1 Tax=Vibrio sp. WXL103 TaxID=3450710 RepID=UPI003EC662F6
MSNFNSRVLIIDDESSVRDAFKIALGQDEHQDHSLDALMQAESALFDDLPSSTPVRNANIFDCHLDFSSNGANAVEKVKQAVESNQPYALIFCDMRMPGMDGLETIKHIREYDDKAHVVFVTAYSDYKLEQLNADLGNNIGYHCKPFEQVEVRQIATKACCDWNKAKQLESLLEIVNEIPARCDTGLNLVDYIAPQLTNIFHGHNSQVFVWEIDSKQMVYCSDEDIEPADAFFNALTEQQMHSEKQCSSAFYFACGEYGFYINIDPNNPISDDLKHVAYLMLKHASQALNSIKLQAGLAKQRELSAVGRASSIIVHDLRQPLNVFEGVLDYIKPTFQSSVEDREAEMLEWMTSACVDMRALIDDILDLSKDKQSQTEVVELNTYLQTLCQQLSITFPEDIELEVNFTSPLLVEIDPQQIRRALINIITNAKEELITHPREKALVEVSLSTKDNTAIIAVKDNGLGIPNHLLESIFEPFVTKGKSNGTGIGLAISRQFVEKNHGQLEVISSAQGSEFLLSFPLMR